MYLFCVSQRASPDLLKPTHTLLCSVVVSLKEMRALGSFPELHRYFSVSLSFHGKPPLSSSTHHRFRHLLRSYMEPRVF